MYSMTFEPAPALQLWAQMCRVGLESQYVIAMRMAGMVGVIPQRPSETMRMVTEKGDAARESISAALTQVTSGARPDQIMAAALKPYSRRTRVNARRLSRAH